MAEHVSSSDGGGESDPNNSEDDTVKEAEVPSKRAGGLVEMDQFYNATEIDQFLTHMSPVLFLSVRSLQEFHAKTQNDAAAGERMVQVFKTFGDAFLRVQSVWCDCMFVDKDSQVGSSTKNASSRVWTTDSHGKKKLSGSMRKEDKVSTH